MLFKKEVKNPRPTKWYKQIKELISIFARRWNIENTSIFYRFVKLSSVCLIAKFRVELLIIEINCIMSRSICANVENSLILDSEILDKLSITQVSQAVLNYVFCIGYKCILYISLCILHPVFRHLVLEKLCCRRKTNCRN